MNVFMVTSVPLNPPWDQGDKNLAYMLTSAMPEVRFRVLTSRQGPAPLGSNLALEPLFNTNRPTLLQKARVFAWLLSRHNGASSNWTLDLDQPKPPDLYHLIYRPNGLSSRLFRVLPEFHRRPTIHTMPATGGDQPQRSSLFFADHVVALSEYGRRILLQSGLERVTHIPPGIDISPWEALRDQAESMKSLLGFAGHPVLLFPGHFSQGYGSQVLVGALPQILAEVPDVRVVFACRLRSLDDLKREKAVHQAIEGMGLSHAVRFYNTVDNMQALIGASDLLVLPLQTMKDKIDIPTSLLEAMAAGKPIIISDIPPMNEILPADQDDQVGLAVPPGDACALAQAILALLKDSALRKRMGDRGQSLVRQRFDICQVARQYEILYRKLIASSRHT